MTEYIIKRNGTKEKWKTYKITKAINEAMRSCEIKNSLNKSKIICDKVIIHIDNLELRVITQELIQDIIETVLMGEGYTNVAKNFIIYREKCRELRENKITAFNILETVDNYLDRKDWRVNENANIDYSFQGLTLNINGNVQSRYMLNKYPIEVREAHNNNFIHIHDLQLGLAPYCSGWSLFDLILEGFNLDNSCSSGPAKHFDSLLGQCVNFIGTVQNEWAGAQALSSFDTLVSPFIAYDKECWEKDLGCSVSDKFVYKRVKQSMQRFLYNLNTTSRWGGQTPFSNLTFDLIAPKHYADMPVIISGEAHSSKTYKDFSKESAMIVKAFLEIMAVGDINNRIFTFPIPTFNITKDFPWESEVGELLLKMTSKYGYPYFQNFINSDLDPSDIRSMCCRLSLNKKEVKQHLKKLEYKGNGLFGAGELTGSIGVVTLNLPLIAYIAKGFKNPKKEYFKLIKKYAQISKTSLEFKRKILNKNLKLGMFPWTKRYLRQGFDSHFSTIGVIGGNEACLNLIGNTIGSDEGKSLMIETLNLLRKEMLVFQKETGNMYNLEATPAEGTSFKLAKNDKKKLSRHYYCWVY